MNIVSDTLLIFAAYFVALYVRFEILDGHRGLNILAAPYLLIAAGTSLVIVVVYRILRMYGSYRFKSEGDEILLILFVNGITSLALMATMYLTRTMEFPRLVVFLFWLFSSLLVITKRAAGRAILRHYRALGYNQKHAVIVGNGHLAQQYLKDIRAKPQLGITVDGYISGVPRPELGTCLGCYEDLEKILEQRDLDELVVALEPHEVRFMRSVLDAADKEGVHVTLIPFYNDYIPSHPSIDVVGQTKLINLRATPLDNFGWAMLKRLMDIVGSLVLIFLTSPIMLIAAIGVKLSSPGPVLFKQERIGLNKKPFQMLKFRSMRVTGTETTGWTTNNDPRKTRFGSFIRKYSIDELPQAFNVLAGKMSLVGPRPEVPFHVRHFKEEIPLYLVRQQVRPGITGWAQVHGLRGDTSIEERVKFDIWYIENWTIFLDIQILWKTVFGGMVNSEKVQSAKKDGKA